jgi:hypothetical protein
MTSRRFLLVVALAAAGLGLALWSGSTRSASAAAADFDGVQVLTTANAVGFFDARSGDMWLHAFQADGSLRVTRLHATARGEKLVVVSDTK